MILTCPSCQKRYMIESREIGSKGRLVRCVACRHTWQQKLDEDMSALADLTADFFSEKENIAVSKRHPAIWILMTAGIILLLGSFLMARNTIVSHWPSTEKFFSRIGFSVSNHTEGLQIENIAPVQLTQGMDSMIVLKGDLVNTSSLIRTIPTLHIIVKGDCKGAPLTSQLKMQLKQTLAKMVKGSGTNDGLCTLEEWDYNLSESRLFPSERLSFETTPHAMVEGAKDITVEF
ncbi:MAG: hypothetical protein BGO76_01040 [Caedibacter sp. 38-128]|nr:zinc-ribbon domain-containing protein [Holosporales bacterium]OJX05726.1 MAG: hypothetical protein BGO76_01040 [Caedibacter sp. 38-128]